MKRLLRTFLLLAIISPTYAYDFQVGDLCYNITNNTEPYTVEVTSSNMYSSSYSGLDSVDIPSVVEYENKVYNVTNIGDFAFYGCYTLKSVTIPNSVIKIGSVSFADCYNLTSVSISSNMEVIGSGAFAGCSLPVCNHG